MGWEQILKDLVSLNSSFPNEKRIAEYIEMHLKKQGFKTQRIYVEKNRFDVIAERGHGKKAVMFYGHMDTVPIYGEWRSNPLKLTVKGDKMFGLGARDMKGSVAAILDSISDASSNKIKLLFCVDEENDSKGAWTAVRKRKSWFNDVALIVSGDGAASRISDGGANVITLGRRGRCVINIEITGLSAHGADPGRGINALEEAAKIVAHIRHIKLRRHRNLQDETLFVKALSGHATSLSLPDKACVELDFHFVPPSTKEEVKRRVVTYIEHLQRKGVLHNDTAFKVTLKKRDMPYLEPYLVSKKDKNISKIMELMKNRFGKLAINYGRSVADDNVLANELKIPLVTIWPIGGNSHAQNEWTSRKSLDQIVRLYKDIIQEIKP